MASETIPEEPASKLQKLETNGKHDQPINVDSPLHIRKVKASETIPEEPASKLQKLETNGKPLLWVKKLSANAVLPSRGSSLSAGYDLSSASGTIVPARGKAMVPTDLSIGIPGETYARIAPRSGLAWKHSIHVGAGVIDADYRGPVGVILFNLSDADFEVKAGDRITQLIIQKIITPQVLEVEDLDLTVRVEENIHDQAINVDSPMRIRKVMASETIPEEPPSKLQKLETNGKHDQPINVDSPMLRVKKLSANAVLPSKGSSLSAGYDLSSASATIVPARGKAKVPTDLSIGIPEDTYARIAPRSGLAWKHSIDVGAGVIDADYRGPVGVILFNHSDADFEVKGGDRIAQLIIEKIMIPQALDGGDLDLTVRGEGGFGSTGV